MAATEPVYQTDTSETTEQTPSTGEDHVIRLKVQKKKLDCGPV